MERENKMQEPNAPRSGRSRDLFGVQLEVRVILFLLPNNLFLCNRDTISYKIIEFRMLKMIVKTFNCKTH